MKFRMVKVVVIWSLMLLGLSPANSHQKKDGVLSFFSEKDFNHFFPHHHSFYTYKAFKRAVEEMRAVKIRIEKRGIWIFKVSRTDRLTGKTTIVRQDPDWEQAWAKQQPYSSVEIDYGDFCAYADKKEAAAFFAHIAHETRNGTNGKFDDGLMLKQELRNDQDYIISNKIYPPSTGQKYYGRGPLQLSYNGNYGFASTVIYGDKNRLLDRPDLVVMDPVLSFKTALYFWMTPQSMKPSAHMVMSGSWKASGEESKSGYAPGFGMTINIINGSVECNKGQDNPAMKDRIGFYQHFLKLLDTQDPDCKCSCAAMVPFPS